MTKGIGLDKWLFTKSYFNDLADKYNLGGCVIYSLNKSERPFKEQLKTHAEGNNIKNLPGWLWDIVDEYEKFFSQDGKMDLLTEGCIIIKK